MYLLFLQIKPTKKYVLRYANSNSTIIPLSLPVPLWLAFSTDAGYRSTTLKFLQGMLKWGSHIPTKIGDVERTFAWLSNFRQLAKNVEILTATAENFVRVAMLNKNDACQITTGIG
ncbi:hypothetical protein EHS17_09375 [Rhodobacteraceae bacterium CH30]|nr:hypothetical protein EHS17_09375 [Rhodobacteraceae bacterium CH30]